MVLLPKRLDAVVDRPNVARLRQDASRNLGEVARTE